MADLADIPDEDVALDGAMQKVGLFIKDILPNHQVYLFDGNYPDSVSPHVIVESLEVESLSGGLSDQPRYYDVSDTGVYTYVYENNLVILLSAYIGKPLNDLRKVKKFLRNKAKRIEFFSDGLYGIQNIGTVTQANVLVDNQKMQSGATMQLTVSYLHKHVDNTGEVIDVIEGRTDIKDEFGNVLDSSPWEENPYPEGADLQHTNDFHQFVNEDLVDNGWDNEWAN